MGDQCLGWVSWALVWIAFPAGILAAVAAVILGKIFSMPHVSKGGLIGVFVVLGAALLYLVIPGILAGFLGAVAAMLFAGRLIARHGSVRVLAVFALAAVPVLPLVVLAPSLWLLAPAMAAFGALIGCMDVAMNANAVEVERRLGRAIMSLSLIHLWRCRRAILCRSRWAPAH